MHEIIDSIDNEIDTIPRSVLATSGTIDSVNDNRLIIGTGTVFLTDFVGGDWMFVAAKSEVRQIERVESDTELYLKEPFTGAALSGATYRFVKDNLARLIMISWLTDAAGAVDINGSTFPASASNTWGKSKVERSSASTRLDPVVFDSRTNGGSIAVTGQY
jgi:hypothetical protein